MAKIIALFVEGPTEIEFYKAVVQYAHEQMKTKYSCSFEWIDMKGIGNYKNNALRKFNNLKNKHPDDEIYVILCIDTDVFDLTKKKPPIDKQAVKISLEKAGAQKVTYVEARYSIEDWFLSDLAGVISYLRLPKDTKRPTGKGQDALKTLFRKANKVYIKGGKTEGFIKKLDISKIMSTHCKALKPLCIAIGVDCKTVCKKLPAK